MVAAADQTAAVAEAFSLRMCFVCADVMGARPVDQRLHSNATHIWISGPPKFLAIMLCGRCYLGWLTAARTSSDHEKWPTAHFKIE